MIKTIAGWIFSSIGAVTIGILFGTAIGSGGNPFGCSLEVPNVVETQVEDKAQIEEEPTDTPVEEPKPAGEIKPTEVEKPAEEKPAISAPNTSAKVVPTISKMETVIETYADYEVTILGTCPNQRDKSNKWEEGNRLNAIGIITSGENLTSPLYSLNHHIETWWNSYRKGTLPNTTYLGKYMMANLTQIDGFDKTWANTRIAMYIDFDGLFVNWDNSWEDGKTISATTVQMLKLDQIASDGTNYLRWLDATYNSKCPND